MRQGALRMLVAGTCVAVLGACSTKPAGAERTLSLDEVYSISERVNAEAEPYPLGTGDGLGQQTYTVYRLHERMTAAEEPAPE